MKRALETAYQTLKGLSKHGRFTDGGGLIIIGIQQRPAENIAIVDFNFNGAIYRSDLSTKQLGVGHALLKHYSDGRWVLTDFDSGEPWEVGSMTTNIEIR